MNFHGSKAPEKISLSGNCSRVRLFCDVLGITGSEPAADSLQVNTLGGNDEVRVASDVSQLIAPVIDPGADQ